MDLLTKRLDWFRVAFTTTALLLAILWGASLFAHERRGPFRTSFEIPLAPGRSLHVHVGNRQTWRSFEASWLEPAPVGLREPRVEMWYRRQRVWPGSYLGSYSVPGWPLPALAGGLSLVLAGTIVRHRLVRR